VAGESEKNMGFQGYARDNDRFGVRNHLLVLSTVACANPVVDAIGRALPDVVPVTHGYGCGTGIADYWMTLRVLTGLVNNPNVGAVLLLGLGCEVLKPEALIEASEGKPIEKLVIQEDGGSAATTDKGIAIAERFLAELGEQESVAVPSSALVVGLQCGGSDALSGISANPAVGVASDRFIADGATVILAETTEMIGTKHILKRRSSDPELGNRVEKLVTDQEALVREELGELAGLAIAPGNIEGGLSSIAEKSLGCITKGGTTPINELLEYAEPPSKTGLVVMDTPGYDIESMSAMAAAGAQLILFTTGMGTPAGCPAVPVVKISSNSRIFENMPGDMDLNAGTVIDGDKTSDEMGQEIFEFALAVASGERTCAEKNKYTPFGFMKQGPSL
jgi:altronate dehydratase large subunit